jgi:hypothetical protein
MPEQLSNVIPLRSETHEAGQQKPWEARVEAIRSKSKDNLKVIVDALDPKRTSETPEAQARIEEIRESLGVTINFYAHETIPYLLGEGCLRPHLEDKEPGPMRKLKTAFLDKMRARISTIKHTRSAEERLGIRPEGWGSADDPELVYGAVTDSTPEDETKGGAGGWYGLDIFVLKPDRIKDRATITPMDSYYIQDPRMVVTWEDVPTLMYLRDEGRADPTANYTRGEYVEAQIAGGVGAEDIEEIKFYISNPDGTLDEVLDQYGGRAVFEEKMPGVKLTGIPGHARQALDLEQAA